MYINEFEQLHFELDLLDIKLEALVKQMGPTLTNLAFTGPRVQAQEDALSTRDMIRVILRILNLARTKLMEQKRPSEDESQSRKRAKSVPTVVTLSSSPSSELLEHRVGPEQEPKSPRPVLTTTIEISEDPDSPEAGPFEHSPQASGSGMQMPSDELLLIIPWQEVQLNPDPQFVRYAQFHSDRAVPNGERRFSHIPDDYLPNFPDESWLYFIRNFSDAQRQHIRDVLSLSEDDREREAAELTLECIDLAERYNHFNNPK